MTISVARTHPEALPPPRTPGRAWAGSAAALAILLFLWAAIGHILAGVISSRAGAGASGAGASAVPATPEEIARLVGDLSAEDWTSRSAATRRLIEIGEPAMPQLRLAAQSGDLETAWRAEEAIREIEWRRQASSATSAGPIR